MQVGWKFVRSTLDGCSFMLQVSFDALEDSGRQIGCELPSLSFWWDGCVCPHLKKGKAEALRGRTENQMFSVQMWFMLSCCLCGGCVVKLTGQRVTQGCVVKLTA